MSERQILQALKQVDFSELDVPEMTEARGEPPEQAAMTGPDASAANPGAGGQAIDLDKLVDYLKKVLVVQ